MKLFSSIFNEIFNDFEKDFISLSKELENNAKLLENDEKDEKNKSYFHEVADKYEDGEHVFHKEKEVKDGKVLKNVEQDFKKIEDKSEDKKDEVTYEIKLDDHSSDSEKNANCSNNICNEWVEKKENKDCCKTGLESKIKELEEKVKELDVQLVVKKNLLKVKNDRIAELENENKELNEKLERIKNLF